MLSQDSPVLRLSELQWGIADTPEAPQFGAVKKLGQNKLSNYADIW